MKAILLLSVLLVGAMCHDIQSQLMKDLFQQWKINHNKQYAFDFEETWRFNAFVQNYLAIVQHNSQGDSAVLGLNHFADLTTEEFGALYTGTFLQNSNAETVIFNVDDAPTSVDWRKEGAVTDVKNQGQCGSCWAFSATGALEGLNFLTTGSLLSFSEQQLVDCVTADQGCNGGLPSDAFDYTAQNGIELESDYPYKGVDGKCDRIQSKVHNVNSGYANVTTQSADQLKAAVAKLPVSVGIQANQLVFQFYTGGVIKKFCGDNIDHGVLAVGYDVINGNEAYIVKNSWGGSWGNSGYVYISTDGTPNQGNGVCGILSMPTVPVA